MNLTEFLLDRIAEDEAVSRVSQGGGWSAGVRMVPQPDGTEHWESVAPGWVLVEPRRVLAECAAKRQMVEMYEFQRSRLDAYRSPRSRAVEDEKATQDRLKQEARSRVAEDMLLAIASAYADHPDYDESWRS